MATVEGINRSLGNLKEILEQYESLINERDSLLQERDTLKERLDEFVTVKVERDELLQKLEYSRRTKGTLRKIQTLGDLVENLNEQLRQSTREASLLQKKIDEDTANVVWANDMVGWMDRVARRLSVKPDGRTRDSLMVAVEDAIRKLF